MITFNILERVIWIRINEKYGTGFTYTKNNKSFIITAKHIVDELIEPSFIEIYYNNEWEKIEIKKIEISISPIDIAVVLINGNFTNEYEIDISKIYFLGEDVYFLGFPYGINSNLEQYGLKLPFPFVKKATISMVKKENENILILLDGHNNSGFSGGPVIKMNKNKVELISVISGYESIKEKIFLNDKETKYFYNYNTGIIVSYGIKHAMDLIDKILKENIKN